MDGKAKIYALFVEIDANICRLFLMSPGQEKLRRLRVVWSAPPFLVVVKVVAFSFPAHKIIKEAPTKRWGKSIIHIFSCLVRPVTS